MPDKDFDTVASVIGELRADNRRHFEQVSLLAAEFRRLAEKMEQVALLSTTLTEYRRTLHDRFDRINEAAASHTLDITELEKSLKDEGEKRGALEKRLTSMETTWRTQLKMIAVAGSLILTVGGWVAGSYGPMILKLLFGGG